MPDSEQPNQSSNEITPELVSKVADEVYRLLLKELRIDYERERNLARRWPHWHGGGR